MKYIIVPVEALANVTEELLKENNLSLRYNLNKTKVVIKDNNYKLLSLPYNEVVNTYTIDDEEFNYTTIEYPYESYNIAELDAILNTPEWSYSSDEFLTNNKPT